MYIIYMGVYIYRERERERETPTVDNFITYSLWASVSSFIKNGDNNVKES